MAKIVPKIVSTPRRKRRHPEDGGYARGDETRAKIIAAALDVFGTHGFGGASTRLLADTAGVTLPALQYYFDGKEGIYQACAEHIAERLEERIGPASAQLLQALDKNNVSRSLLQRRLDEFLGSFADLFLGAHELEHWVLFIIREQAQPTKAFDVIYERVMGKVASTCTAAVARLLDLPQDDPKVGIHTAALVGQIIFFRTGRAAILRFLDWPDFSGDRLALVKETLREHIGASLRGLRKTERGRRP